MGCVCLCLCLCVQVEHVEETHPPTRENLIKLLAAVDKRDKYRFFVKPVTIEQVRASASMTYASLQLPGFLGSRLFLWGGGLPVCLHARGFSAVYRHCDGTGTVSKTGGACCLS